jgi:predicted dithiol-disulfide oxidoreductase (DUF899 family)
MIAHVADSILHTYSTYAHGLEQLLGIYDYLDLTPLGRQLHVGEAQYHDRYDARAG